MSLASIQYMATIPNSSSNTAAANFRFCATKPATIRCAQSAADGPLRRPSIATKPSSIPPPPPPETATAAPQNSSSSVTLEFQRQRAKELQEYFKQKKLEEANQGPFFGFIAKNEISNGRWAMFGFAVGMLTEYATGSDFVDQVKILLSNFGILDLE
ncbi:hypothetical protein SSX86_019809 [Deinandra increscens subsp. villosa]|uniref:Uncharacterized protein n=1 Tax=Deinandra increscens subsp. villosa TaxID=3103831 RepID=A0AAP0CTB4_9ASTR